MSQIERDIYVTRETILGPIQYVQGANAVPLVFHFRDFDIPSGAAARIYMRKVSGAEVYNDATISGNDITVDVTTQMSADAGWNKMTLQVMNGDDILLSFPLVLDVKWSAVSNNSIESKDEFTALENALNQVVPATEAANSAAAAANAAAEAAEEATRDAQDATTDAETATQNANTATQSANAATSSANTAASAANQATEDANAAAEAATNALSAIEGAIQGTLINDNTSSANTVYSSQKIESDFLKKTGDVSATTVSYESTTDNTPPATGSKLGTLVGWLVSKCTGIGNIANLLTVAKTNLVAAVNELRGEIGDLTQLETTEKTDLVAAINETNAGLSDSIVFDSNENGSYIILGGAVQVCWNRLTVNDQAIASPYGDLYHGTRNMTFPKPFAAPPVALCGKFKYSSGASWGTVITTSTTQCLLRGIDIAQRLQGEETEMSYIAIGIPVQNQSLS